MKGKYQMSLFIKNFFFGSIILLILFVVNPAFSITAFEIMSKVDARYTGESAVSTTRMILIDKKDRKRTREIEIFSKDYAEVDKSISFFKNFCTVSSINSFLSKVPSVTSFINFLY